MPLTAQLGAALLGAMGLGSDGVTLSPSLQLDGPASGNAGVDSGLFTVTLLNPTTDVTVTISDSEATDNLTTSSLVLGVATPSGTTYLGAPLVLGDRTISITNSAGLANPSDLVYTVLAVSGQTSMLGQLALGSARLGADANAFAAGISQLYVRPPAITHGRAGVQSGAFVFGILNPATGDTGVTPSNAGVSGTWSPSSLTLNVDTREAIAYFTPASGTSGAATVSAVGNNGASPPPESLTYTVDGNAFYVSANGNDSNNGQSQLTPWLTLAKAQSYGLASMRGGSLSINGGDTFTDVALSISDGNTGANLTDLLTIQAYGTSKPTLTNTNVTTAVIRASGCGGVKSKNLITNGAGATSLQALIQYDGTNAGTLQNLSVEGCECKNAFVGVGFTQSSPVTAPTITGTWFHDCMLAGSFIGAGAQVGGVYRFSAAVITGCTYEDIDGNTTTTGSFQSVGAYILDTNVGTFSGNLLRRISATAANGGGCLVVAHSVAVVASGCEGYSVTGPAGQDAGGINFDWSSRDCIAELNYLHDMDAAGLMGFEYIAGAGARLTGAPAWHNNTYRFNVVQKCARTHFGSIGFFGALLDSIYLYHNTVVTEAGGGNYHIYFAPSGSTVTSLTALWMLNNLFLSDTTTVKVTNLPAAASTNAEQHWLKNLYYSADAGTPDVDWLGSSYGSIAAWQSATGQDASAITGNPLLNDAFTSVNLGNPALISSLSKVTPTSGASPAVGSGLDLTQSPYSFGGIVNSINGRPASQGGVYDVGAAKFISSVTASVVVIQGANQEVIA